jgi:endonuclease YncB( thermonuclease family)
MNFPSAHRFRKRSRRFGVGAVLFPPVLAAWLVFAFAAHAACGAPAGTVRVVAVDERLDIALADGRTLRLAALDLPQPGRGDPATAAAARDFLAARLVGREVELELFGNGPDRWGREAADLAIGGAQEGLPESAAAEMLRAGYARVRPDFETKACAAARLALEDSARRASLGLWRDPEYSVVRSSDLSALRRREGRFVVIEGRVRRVGFGRSRVYVDLAPRGGATIVVARKLEPAFIKAGHALGGLAGERIRARGALDGRFGFRLEVSDPAMVEVLRRSDARGVD